MQIQEAIEAVVSAPAIKWDAEALPIGNGRMGPMLFADIQHERIQIN